MPWASKRSLDGAEVRRAVREVPVVVVLGEHLDVGRGNVAGALHAGPIELEEVGHALFFSQVRHQGLAKVPQGAGDDEAGGVRILSHVIRPVGLVVGGIDFTQRFVRVEEASAHAGIRP